MKGIFGCGMLGEPFVEVRGKAHLSKGCKVETMLLLRVDAMVCML